MPRDLYFPSCVALCAPWAAKSGSFDLPQHAVAAERAHSFSGILRDEQRAQFDGGGRRLPGIAHFAILPFLSATRLTMGLISGSLKGPSALR